MPIMETQIHSYSWIQIYGFPVSVSMYQMNHCTGWFLLISDHKIATWVTVNGGFYSSVSWSRAASGCLVSEDTVCMGAVAGCRAPPPPATCAVKISSKYFYRRGGKYFLLHPIFSVWAGILRTQRRHGGSQHGPRQHGADQRWGDVKLVTRTRAGNEHSRSFNYGGEGPFAPTYRGLTPI